MKGEKSMLFMPVLAETPSGVTVAVLTDVASGIGNSLTWFWTIFGNLMNAIVTNSLLLWGAGLSIVCGAILLAVKVIRRFGIKSRR